MPSERAVRTVAALLALAGIGVATYIAVAEAGGGAPQCLAGGHGCQVAADSSYSHLAGVNVAVLGIAGYALLLLCALAGGDVARVAGMAIAIVGFGYSAYLTYVELFVIDAICEWCVASGALMTLLLVANLVRAFGYLGAGLVGAGHDPTAGHA